MRLPHVGQSFRSRWAICRHHGQKRRFSTAQGSRDCDGASGSTLPTTSRVSPRVAVAVDLTGLGLEQDLASGRRVAQAVTLSGAHRRAL